MQRFHLAWYSLLTLFCLLQVVANSRATSMDHISQEEYKAYFGSVVHVGQRVFASIERGLYSADATEEKWIKLETPPYMPNGGKFATGSSPGDSLIYYLTHSKPVNRDDEFSSRPRIYISRGRGRTWKFVSNRLLSCMHSNHSVSQL